jgi:hypothetical protein
MTIAHRSRAGGETKCPSPKSVPDRRRAWQCARSGLNRSDSSGTSRGGRRALADFVESGDTRSVQAWLGGVSARCPGQVEGGALGRRRRPHPPETTVCGALLTVASRSRAAAAVSGASRPPGLLARRSNRRSKKTGLRKAAPRPRVQGEAVITFRPFGPPPPSGGSWWKRVVEI